MKKYILLFCSVVFIFGLTSCVDESMDFDTNGGKGLDFVHFVRNTQTLSAKKDAYITTITVGKTHKSTQAQTYTLSIIPDIASPAIEGTHYTLSSNTITIPAGEYTGSITLTADVNNLPTDIVSVTFTINSDEAIDWGKSMKMNMHLVCDFDASLLIGDYSYESDDWDEAGTGLTFEADPDDPLKIFVTGYPQSEGLTGNGNRIELNINPVNFSITGPKVIIADDLLDWGLEGTGSYAFQVVSGSFDVCKRIYYVTFNITLSSWGNQGNYEFIFRP